jgi:hypothetical protein
MLAQELDDAHPRRASQRMTRKAALEDAPDADAEERSSHERRETGRVAGEEAAQEEIVTHRELELGAAHAKTAVGVRVQRANQDGHVGVASVRRDDEASRIELEALAERADAEARARIRAQPERNCVVRAARHRRDSHRCDGAPAAATLAAWVALLASRCF